MRLQMKRFLTLLFGNVGLVISGVLMSIISWFSMPAFIDGVSGEGLSKIVGWVLCPFAICFFLSAVCSSVTLIARGIKTKQWWWLVAGAIILLFDVILLILNLI